MSAIAIRASCAPRRACLSPTAVQPPAPPPPPPTGAAPPTTAPPPPSRKPGNWVLPVALGCLVLLVVLGIGAVIVYRHFAPQVARAVQEGEQATSGVAAGPSEAAATAAALKAVPGTAAVLEYADDWTSATIKITPENAGADQAVMVTLKWDEASHAYEATVPVGSDVAPDAVDPRAMDRPLLGDGKPDSAGGGSETAAKAKALGMCPDQTWVVEVNRHEDDWSAATVKIGADPGHFVAEIDFIWDAGSKDYKVTDTRSLTGAGGTN